MNILLIQSRICFPKDNDDLGIFWTIWGSDFGAPLKKGLGATSAFKLDFRRVQKSANFQFYHSNLVFGGFLDFAKVPKSTVISHLHFWDPVDKHKTFSGRFEIILASMKRVQLFWGGSLNSCQIVVNAIRNVL